MHLSDWSDLAWGIPTITAFLGVGLLYSVRLRFLQVRRLPEALRSIFRRDQSGGVSPYGALCTSLAATIGTGNIVGVATAVCAGGPGALFWMMVAAFFGMATQYAEAYLAVKARRNGEHFGGPFYYIEHLRFGKPLAVAFALMGAAAGLLGVGTLTQVNSITSALEGFFSSPALFSIHGRAIGTATVLGGLIVTVTASVVLLGGVKRIAGACELIVPLMSALYLGLSFVILLRFGAKIPAAFGTILRGAFCPRAVLGAGCGIGVKAVMRMGIGRGVFTNEAGLGTTPITAALSSDDDPQRQGLVSMTGTFIDTIVICSITGLCLVVTDAWRLPLEGGAITDAAWRAALPFPESLSSFLLMLCLIFFAFSTIIGWNVYAETCLRYLTGGRGQRAYRMLYLAMVAVGPYISVRAAWESADILNALMALPNLAALVFLSARVTYDAKTKRSTMLARRR